MICPVLKNSDGSLRTSARIGCSLAVIGSILLIAAGVFPEGRVNANGNRVIKFSSPSQTPCDLDRIRTAHQKAILELGEGVIEGNDFEKASLKFSKTRTKLIDQAAKCQEQQG
jgi:hypothetical protein